MSILSQVNSGVTQAGVRVVIAGTEKVGKTTFACSAPRPLLIPLEIGYGAMPVHKTPMIENYENLMQLFNEINQTAASGNFPFRTIVIDSATALERILHDKVLRTDPKYSQKNSQALTMEAALGGYGKAYTYANELFWKFTQYCDYFAQYYGINIVLTCHVFPSTIKDPTVGEFTSWDLQLHSPKNEKTYGKRELVTQWADLLGFLHEPLYLIAGGDDKMSRAISQNKGRILGLERTPSYVAGNRYGIKGEISIPPVSGWNYLAQAIHENSGVDVFNRD